MIPRYVIILPNQLHNSACFVNLTQRTVTIKTTGAISIVLLAFYFMVKCLKIMEFPQFMSKFGSTKLQIRNRIKQK